MTGPLRADVAGSTANVDEFEAFVRSTHRRLLAHARRRLDYDDALAEDLVQEAYLRLWRVWPTRREILLKVISYSYRTLERCIQEYWRIKNNWPVTQGAAPVQTVAAADDGVIIQSLVRDAVNELPHRIREVIELNMFDDLPMADVAERMGIAIGTARNYKTAGLSILREHLGGEFLKMTRSAQ